jgi:hypothetical protein
MPTALVLLGGWLAVVFVTLIVAIAFCRMAKDNLLELHEIHRALPAERSSRVPADRSDILHRPAGDRAPARGRWPR